MAKKRITVIEESDSGRNKKFQDNRTGNDMTCAKIMRQIESGNFEVWQNACGWHPN